MKCPRLTATFFLILFVAACGSPSATKFIFATGVAGPLAISALAPNSAPVNSVPFTMVVNGNNFTTGAQVFWNGVPQFTEFVNTTQLQVSVTEEDLMLPGSAEVYVRNDGMNSNTVEFAVTF